MRNQKMKHILLRLDLLESYFVEAYPTKIFYKYPEREKWPKGFAFKVCAGRIIIEKDNYTKQILFDSAFVDEIKDLYPFFSLPNDDGFVINDLGIFFKSFISKDEDTIDYELKSIAELDDYTKMLWIRVDNQ